MTILVTGATGTVGSEVVKLLSQSNDVRLRVASRTPKAGGVVFSYDDAASMTAACQGADAVFWVMPPAPDHQAATERFLFAAKNAGIKHIVKLSVVSMADPEPMIVARWHNEMETALRATGIPWTSLRPNGFMQNFLGNSAPRPDGGMYLPIGNGAASYIDVRDIAAVAVKALTEAGQPGKIYELTGPEALTGTQVAQALSQVTGREIGYVDVPEAAARQAMLGAHMPPWMVDMILDIQLRTKNGTSAKVTQDVEMITGKPATTFLQFARDHAGRWISQS